MIVLQEIFHSNDINLSGKIIYREAARGIIIDKHKLLMVYSPKNGDYKFPGGGVEDGETYEGTLCREVEEECGYKVERIEQDFGCLIEYSQALEKDYDVFKMTSFYYVCKVGSDFSRQNLDRYEKELDFKPVWVDIDDAIKNNKSIIDSVSDQAQWTIRDTFVLEQVKKQLF